MVRTFLKKHEAISSDTITSITDIRDSHFKSITFRTGIYKHAILLGYASITIVGNQEVISRTLIFI